MKQKIKQNFYQLGKNITKLREEYGMSLEDLSLKSGIRKRYLVRIEQGIAYGLRLSHLENLAVAFDGNLKDILKDL